MKIKTLIQYDEEYIPHRCRKPRYKMCEEYVDLELKKIKNTEVKRKMSKL